ncbi:MAG: cysteine--tRNA ligase [Defluviitaleaceae bacterium]|nr:cysteine--tRNA ligase [Defluviitaleaceae bacterium]
MKIYNTMTRKKETLEPLEPNKIKMYTCGQTVYNDIHMGNARFYVVFDAIRRYLVWRGFDVNFVQNFTDIDDKIIAKANEENCDCNEIAERYIARTKEDLAELGCEPATKNPLATEEIPAIITLIEELIEKGFAYENGGTVYYDVAKFLSYGKLSGKKIDDLEAGARVEVEAGKRNPMDFVLWKPAKPDEPKWASPWGDGRPGWHIECSAMIREHLGDKIDIHGGAEDLIFPHHENEIAQTEAVTGCDLAKYWMHCGILTTDHKKMSKSRGNFFTYREMKEKFSPDVMRFYFLSGHYRMPMEFNDEVLRAAEAGLGRIKTCYENLIFAENEAAEAGIFKTNEAELNEEARNFEKLFVVAMNDDFNTADAITAIFEFVKFVNTKVLVLESTTKDFIFALKHSLSALCEILGVNLASFNSEVSTMSALDIESLLSARQEARKNKNFAESDRIRDELASMGITIEDTPSGVRWRKN